MPEKPQNILTHRLATRDDLPALKRLMDKAIKAHIGALVDQQSLEFHYQHMGLDTQLIEDGTYFMVQCDGALAGCGGWSRRATLFGGDHSDGRNSRLLDPANEAARVRAMYTDPDFARLGVGRLILGLSEQAAGAEGFTEVELFATISGEPLYKAYGFNVISRDRLEDGKGAVFEGALMRKEIATALP